MEEREPLSFDDSLETCLLFHEVFGQWMIDRMRFFKNPNKAINIVRKLSHIRKEKEVVAHVVVTIAMFALMIQRSLWLHSGSLMAAKI